MGFHMDKGFDFVSLGSFAAKDPGDGTVRAEFHDRGEPFIESVAQTEIA